MTALSLVIPCYNEAQNLPLLVERLDQIVSRDDVEIILVDNGSSDETPELLQRYRSDRAFLETVRVAEGQHTGADWARRSAASLDASNPLDLSRSESSCIADLKRPGVSR